MSLSDPSGERFFWLRVRHVVRQEGTEFLIRAAGWWGTQHNWVGGGRVAHGQPLVTPFRSGLNKPQGAVKRSRTQCGDITGTQSACWQQARHVTLELAK